MTTTAQATCDRTAALTGALTARGWTYTRPISTDSQWRSTRHQLESTDGLLHIDAAAYPDGFMIAQLSAEAVRTEPQRRPGWMAEIHEVPLTAVFAAIAASEPPEQDLPATLLAAGWSQQPDVCERGRVLERRWTSPDATRSVSWDPGDEHDLGGWTVTRPGPDGHPADTQASQHTPPPVLAALALTD